MKQIQVERQNGAVNIILDLHSGILLLLRAYRFILITVKNTDQLDVLFATYVKVTQVESV